MSSEKSCASGGRISSRLRQNDIILRRPNRWELYLWMFNHPGPYRATATIAAPRDQHTLASVAKAEAFASLGLGLGCRLRWWSVKG